MNDPIRDDFFIAGGTLRANASSYIKRSADDELYNHIKAGEFCYVLTPRQMGKSSLMVSTALRLRKDGFAAAKIDLTKIGTTDIGRWYLGILTQIEKELKLGTHPGKWWKDHEQLSPVQAFIYFLREDLLPKTNRNIVIFIDEIDSTLKYEFRDDFFAGIRSVYNSRAEDPQYNRLTFVLLGVAAPTDLIKDRTRTPFNIGQEISLSNFSREEVSIFEAGLEETYPGQSAHILDHIYYWSNGHPYLTQKFCVAITDQQKTWNEEAIDNFVKQSFLSQEAYRETNLQFVRDMLVKNPQKRQLLSLYARIRKGGKISEDKKSSLQNQLRLSGLIKSENSYLSVNNKIYYETFNLEWIRENTEINWSPYVTGIAIFVAVALAVIIYYNNTSVPNQARQLTDCASNHYNAERLACLSDLFQLSPLFSSGNDYDETARGVFFKLDKWQYQKSFFEPQGNDPGDIVIITKGLYTALADIDGNGNNTRLLEEMNRALHLARQGEEVQGLGDEIASWIEARNLMSNGKSQDALSKYDDAVRINSKNPATLFERAQLYIRIGEYEKALSDFESVVALSKESAAPTSQEETQVPPASQPTETAVLLPNGAEINPAITGTPTSLDNTVPIPTLIPTYEIPLEPDPVHSSFSTYSERTSTIRDIISTNENLLSILKSVSTNSFQNLIDIGFDPTILSTNLAPGSTIEHLAAKGEWLEQLAQCYGANFDDVKAANPQIADPDLIQSGITVTIPQIGSVGRIYGPPCVSFYTVQAGDTWESIAQRYNAELAILQRVNPVELTAGTSIKIPLNSAGGGAVSVTPVPLTSTPFLLEISQTDGQASAWFGEGNSYINVGQGQSFAVNQTATIKEFSIYLQANKGNAQTDQIICDLRNARMVVIQSSSINGFASGEGWKSFAFNLRVDPGIYMFTCYLRNSNALEPHTYSIHGNANDNSYLEGIRYTSTGGHPEDGSTWFVNGWDLKFRIKMEVQP
jgi:tetratricopeptide (TPR) repeat protein